MHTSPHCEAAQDRGLTLCGCAVQEAAQEAAATAKKFSNVENSLRGGQQFYTDLQARPSCPPACASRNPHLAITPAHQCLDS